MSGMSAHDIPAIEIDIVRPVNLTPRVAGPDAEHLPAYLESS
jgi:hypothetical protein